MIAKNHRRGDISSIPSTYTLRGFLARLENFLAKYEAVTSSCWADPRQSDALNT